MKIPKRRQIPFEFVVEELETLDPMLRPMFGCTAIYLGEKIVLILRQREDHPRDNGVWVATLPEHLGSLRAEYPSLRRIELFGKKETAWQNLPEESPDFEEAALRVCAALREGDPRIGKVPKARRAPKRARAGGRK